MNKFDHRRYGAQENSKNKEKSGWQPPRPDRAIQYSNLQSTLSGQAINQAASLLDWKKLTPPQHRARWWVGLYNGREVRGGQIDRFHKYEVGHDGRFGGHH
jgi:hypothetical protein